MPPEMAPACALNLAKMPIVPSGVCNFVTGSSRSKSSATFQPRKARVPANSGLAANGSAEAKRVAAPLWPRVARALTVAGSPPANPLRVATFSTTSSM